jgi:RNA polymerase sigma-70 factor (ECF subfamily)
VTVAKSLSLDDARGAGDESFDTLFGRYYGTIYAVLFRLTGDRVEADDLAQETFLRLYRSVYEPGAGDGRPRQKPDNVGGWLYRVATHLGYNALRAARRRLSHEQAAAEPESAQTVDPVEEVARIEQCQLVRQAMAELTPQQVQLLVLRHAGLSYKELAAVLGVAPASIGALLARAERAFEARYRARAKSEIYEGG